ncbi:ribosomal protein S18-alanine N-acetyltransferase [Streptomyces radicis]|uniref:Ribosomal-protein-alanine N-acetyltransferase n=1 Tax=Streptomyces radicis TaxID=1750517 RepID=A0A3A9W4J2_9ACTN|nr:ribosomal protein S18-alanine N-acetyltransferase [Streptomyces radicis]RKN08088.1 ribosomal-protein-alanine N-acetyltransferase [Streptomyces radicis]RKN20443.1 ribosomal-protein-alanine N-acetyltransferase [Streptomyces radicis]
MTTGDAVTGRDGVALREMRWWDMAGVLALEAELFPRDAWSEAMYWAELAGARGPGRTRHYVVAEAPDGTLAGYGGLSVAGASGEVMTIGVTGARQGRGLGALVLAELLAAAEEFACDEVLLEVRVDNAPAQRLYQRFGFVRIGVRRGYYQPGNHDALVMRRALDDRSDGAAPGNDDGETKDDG